MTEKIYILLMLTALLSVLSCRPACSMFLSVTEAAIPRDQCPLACTKIGFPVCGSDGRTYGNPCELRAGNCLKSPYQQVTLVRNGTCDTTTTYPQTVSRPKPKKCTLVCTADYTPVCGSDGNTYCNTCQVRVRNCRGSPYDQVTIVSNGTCATTTTSTTTSATTTTTTTYQTTSQVNPPRDCPDVCFFLFDPVCGSDGKTYGNLCLLGIENCKRFPYDQVEVVRNGSCDTTPTTTTPATYQQTEAAIPRDQCQLFCTRIGFPVCGSDGRTYGNPCELRAENCLKSPYQQVTLVRNGTCDTTTTYTQTVSRPTSTKCTLVCTEDYTPVCGSDGNTYSNACQVRVRNCRGSAYDQVTIVSNGTCETTTPATTTTSTTTTTATYQTTSQANPHRDCPDACIFLFDPVCGSDGKTYGNLCLLGIENCKRFPYDQVVVVRNGSCDTTPTTTTPATYQQTEPVNPYGSSCNLACTRELNQVCGSDGNTYNNPCLLRVGNCERSPYNQVVLVRNGSCDTTRTTYRQTVPYPTPTACSLVCTDDYTPVCGSDGKTYSNACQVRVRNCRGSPYDQVTIASNGTCETATTTITTTSTSRYPTIEPVTTPDACPGIYQRTWDPVCGSDGNEYRNPCVLRAENCFRSPYQQITKVSNGSCEALTSTNNPKTVPEPLPTDCSLAYTEVYAPVCGSDGNTYSNACQLRERNCRGSPDNQITIVSNGSCETTTTTRTSTSTSRYPTVYP